MLGSIDITTSEGHGAIGVQFDRVAIDTADRVMLLSVITDSTRAKALRAALHANRPYVRATCPAKLTRPTAGFGIQIGNRSSLSVSPHGYETTVFKLGFGSNHVLFRSRDPNFMAVVDDQAIWNQLRDGRFTTPVLRHWVPWIRSDLESRDLLSRCWGHNCDCGLLLATPEQLDEAVSRGVREGHLDIPDPDVIDAEFSKTPNPILALEHQS